MSLNPTQRSVNHLRKVGYVVANVANVEKWIHQINRRRDMFGLFDLVACKPGEVMFVQTTSASNVSSRIKKITGSKLTPILRQSPVRLMIHGWSKRKARWNLREVDVTEGDDQAVDLPGVGR